MIYLATYREKKNVNSYFVGTRNALLPTTDHYILFYFRMYDCIEYTFILLFISVAALISTQNHFDSYAARIETYQFVSPRFVSIRFDLRRCGKKKCPKWKYDSS